MTNRGIEGLLETWEPRIRKAFLSAMQEIADAAQIGIIEARLRSGDVEGALEAVGLDPARFRGLDLALAQTFEAGGNNAARGLPAIKRAGEPLLKVLFDIRNPRAEQWLKDRAGGLIREIVDDQRDMIREHLRAGMEAGDNPRTVALDLAGRMQPNGHRAGGAIGLTNSQEQWVRNYRNDLSNLRPSALDRALRDKRFDRTVAAAVKSGQPISEKQIDAMVRSYRNRALKYRADGIARTEAIRALNQSQSEATRQAIDKGQFSSLEVTKVWVTSRDGRERSTHRAMHGQEVGFEASFVSPSGAALRFPGDPDAPASETINCRCFYRINVNYLKGLR